MNINTKRLLPYFIGLLILLCAASIFLTFQFEEVAKNQHVFFAILSGLFCIFVIFVFLFHTEQIQQLPSQGILVLLSYACVALLLCFPNSYMDEFAIMYLIAIPLASFFGFHYAFVSILSIFILNILMNQANTRMTIELLHLAYAMISSALAIEIKQKKIAWFRGLFSFCLLGVLLFLSGLHFYDLKAFLIEILLVVFYSLLIPCIYHMASWRLFQYNSALLVPESETSDTLSVVLEELSIEPSMNSFEPIEESTSFLQPKENVQEGFDEPRIEKDKDDSLEQFSLKSDTEERNLIETKKQYKEEMKEEIKEEQIKEEQFKEEEFIEEIKEEVKEEVEEEIKEEIKEELKEEAKEEIKEEVKEEIKFDFSKSFSMQDLLQKDCELILELKAKIPIAYRRAKEIAEFSKTIAANVGANQDFVYVIAQYKDIQKLNRSDFDYLSLLPDYLKNVLIRQHNKENPTSLEELIVHICQQVFSMLRYIEKTKQNISLEQLIENICNLQLKKGIIMSAGISMSQYHRLKSYFLLNFSKYLVAKKTLQTNRPKENNA